MAFKYEIWKMKLAAIESNGDVFFIDNYEKFLDVNPITSKFDFTLKKQDDEVYYRIEPNGELVFMGEEFGYIRDITQDCTPYLIMAFDQSNVERSSFIRSLFFNKADFIGFIRKRGVVFDYDKCVASVTPDIFDTYTKLLRGINDKFNAFDIVDREFIRGVYFKYDIETWSKEYVSDNIPDPESWPIIDFNENDINPFFRGLRWRMTYSPTPDGKYNITELYAREYAWTKNREAWPEGDPTWTWNKEYNPDNNMAKFVRPVNGIFSPKYKLINNTYYIDLPESRPIFENNNWLQTITKKRGIHLWKLINQLRARIESASDTGFPTLQTQSQILESPNDPVNGGSNKYNNLIILQQSDIGTNSDRATKFELSMKDIFDILSYLNIKWFISENRKLVLEHIKYFENGGYYSPNSQQYMYNLPDNDARNIISFKEEEPPRQETFNLAFALQQDFTGKPIKYASGCSGDNTKEYSFNFTTDVFGLLAENPVDIPPAGAILLHTTRSAGTFTDGNSIYQGAFYTIASDLGVLTNDVLPNAALSIANVHDKMWKHGRALPQGSMNNSNITFSSVTPQYIRNGVPINIRYKQINPYKLVKTKVGDAYVFESRYDLRRCNWQTILEYQDVDYE